MIVQHHEFTPTAMIPVADFLANRLDQLLVEDARVAVLTMLPFLAQPHRFMFLKPEVTQKAADRLLWNLNYTSKLNWLTYSRLLEMRRTLVSVRNARPLIPQRMKLPGEVIATGRVSVRMFPSVIGSYAPIRS